MTVVVTAAIGLLVGAVLAANALTATLGLVPAGFGLLVPAGTYAAAVALLARDWLHELRGLRGVIPAIIVGAAVSAVIDPRLGVASGVAFLLAELADTAVYAPLRERRRTTALLGSQAVGATVDTAVFITLAFGASALTWQTFGGQLLVKVVWVAVPIAALYKWRASRALPVR